MPKIRSKNQESTRLSRTIDAIMKNPRLPTQRIEGFLKNKSDEEVVEYYAQLEKKWSKIIKEKNNGLSLQDFGELAKDYFGDDGLNKDSIHRVRHTGCDGVRNAARTINTKALARLAYFSAKYSYKDLLGMAEEALADGGEMPVRESRRSIASTPVTPVAVPTVISSDSSDRTLGEILMDYVSKNGYESLMKEGMSPTEILDAITGRNNQINISTLLMLRDALGLSADEILRVAENSIKQTAKAL